MLVKLAISLLGMALVIWWNSARKSQPFNKDRWVAENFEAIIFSLIGIIIMAGVYHLSPMSLESVKQLTGMSLVDTDAGWFTFGVLIYEGVRKLKKSR